MENIFTHATYLALLCLAFVIRFVIVRQPVKVLWVLLSAAIYVLLFAALGDFLLLLVAFLFCAVLQVEGKGRAKNRGVNTKTRERKGFGRPSGSLKQVRMLSDYAEYAQGCFDIAKSELACGRQNAESWEKARELFALKNVKEIETEYVKRRVAELKKTFPLTTSDRIKMLEASIEPLLSTTQSAINYEDFDETYPQKHVEVAVLEILCRRMKPDIWSAAREAVESDRIQELELEYVRCKVKQQIKTNSRAPVYHSEAEQREASALQQD